MELAQSDVPLPIRRRLTALRRAVGLWFWIDGLAALCAAAVLLSLASLAIDRVFRMDRMQRALCLAGAAAALGVLAWRRLARPLSRRVADDALGLAIEARRAELGQRVVGALQFARLPDAEAVGYSPGMVRSTIAAGSEAAAGLDFRDALDRRRRSRNLLRIAAAGALAGLACALFPATMGLWFSRNVLLSERAWPQKTHLRVLGAEEDAIACPRGDDLTIHVEADPEGVVPSLVNLRYRSSSGASGGEPMVLVGRSVFRTLFKNVLEPLRFRASGGDATTPWVEVRLVERPAVETLSLSYQPPGYIGKERVRLPSNIGPHPVPMGSTLAIEGIATKDLAEATIAYGKEKPTRCEPTGPRGFRAALAGDGLKSGTYSIALEDTAGYGSKQPARFSLRVVPDLKPTVRAKLEGIGDLIVPRASIPIACRLTDDYAVARAEVLYANHVEGQDEPPPKRLPFGKPELFGAKEIATTHRLEAEPLRLAVGSQLTFRVEATDNDAVTGPKVGVSATFSLRVVTEDELRVELLRREQEQRMEFERLLRDQQKLLENTQALLASLKERDTPALADAERSLLADSEKRQRLVGNRCTAIAERFAALLAEVENNKLEEAETATRQRIGSRIVEPLQLLARRGVLQAADLLDVARRAALAAQPPPDAAPGRAALVQAATEQEQLVAFMKIILKNMIKWEGYQEAVSLLREVLKAEEHVSLETLQEYRKRIEKIFDQ